MSLGRWNNSGAVERLFGGGGSGERPAGEGSLERGRSAAGSGGPRGGAWGWFREGGERLEAEPEEGAGGEEGGAFGLGTAARKGGRMALGKKDRRQRGDPARSGLTPVEEGGWDGQQDRDQRQHDSGKICSFRQDVNLDSHF